ncbi:MAG: oxidoreductase [Betaproteobacteria bacterium]|nr:oxidoreductase [Betaproteobacteria bacterium]
MSAPAVRPRVGVVKFASCDGCQLQLLDLEDELLAVCQQFEIIEFAEAQSSRSEGPFDVLFVEGSVSAPEHLPRIVELRQQAKFLVTIGACATSGGIQALRNWGDHDAFRAAVYAQPEFVASLATSTPIADHVAVDAELRGCPIDPRQLVELLTALTTGRRPQLRDEAVCMECKRGGNTCVMVTRHTPCLGQVTQAGCGAICPRFGRGCYGCFGPREQANVKSLAEFLQTHARMSKADIGRLFAGFSANAEPFRGLVSQYGGAPPKAPAPAAEAAVGAGGGR